jgi:hypothetical protein
MITFDPEIGMRDYIKSEFKVYGHSYDMQKTWESNLIKLNALRRRIPKSIPRSIIELPKIEVPKKWRSGYDLLKNKLISGESIEKHLSNNNRRRNYQDILLNYWGIHHLHLNPEIKEDGRLGRSGEILFAKFYDNAVIFIDILDHTKVQSEFWSNKELIEKIHHYVPEAISDKKSNRLTGYDLKDSERAALHKNRMNYALKMNDGTVYMFSNIMGNGDTLEDWQGVLYYKLKIERLEKIIKQDGDNISRQLGEKELTIMVKTDGNVVEPYVKNKNTLLRFV